MYKHEDPLNQLYTRLIHENTAQDYRGDERDETGHATKLSLNPGLHVYEVLDVPLTTGDAVPTEVEFITAWEGSNYEQINSRNFQTEKEGFIVNIEKVYIPTNVTQADLDEWTGKPGVYAPGMDVTDRIDPAAYKQIIDHITDTFNDPKHWGQPHDYKPSPNDRY